MNSIFRDFGKEELLAVLESAKLEQEAYIVLHEDGTIMCTTKRAQMLADEMDGAPFAQLLSEKGARILHMAIQERVIAEMDEIFDQQRCKLKISPMGENYILVRLYPVNHMPDRAALGIRMETSLCTLIGELVRYSGKNELDSTQLKQKMRQISLKMERELLHGALLREPDSTSVVHFQRGDITALCRAVAEHTQERCDFLIEVEGDICQVVYDEQMLLTCLYNLLTNAAHATNVTRICIRVAIYTENVQIEVSHDGIDLDHNNRFDLLQDAKTGLGIAVCEKLMRMHRGLVICESNLTRMIFPYNLEEDVSQMFSLQMQGGFTIGDIELSVL